MRKQQGFSTFELMALAVIAALSIGWVLNIFKLVGLFDDPINGWLIGRAIGVFFAPLGGVLGWL